MGRPVTTCEVRIAFSDRTIVKGLLAELTDEVEGQVVLRRGRLTEDAAWVELELRTAVEQVEKAFLVVARPGVTVQSYSANPTNTPFSPPAGELTRPPAASLRLPAAVPVC